MGEIAKLKCLPTFNFTRLKQFSNVAITIYTPTRIVPDTYIIVYVNYCKTFIFPT